MEKSYNFTIGLKGVAYGYVVANSEEEAVEKIKNHDWEDIIDIDPEYDGSDIISIEED